MLQSIPEDLSRQVALFLPAPDVLNLFCTQREFSKLGRSACFWRDLLIRDADSEVLSWTQKKVVAIPNSAQQGAHREEASSADNNSDDDAMDIFKTAFLTHAHASHLTSVRWCPLRNHRASRSPSAREGHLMCILGPSTRRKVVLTGGFCQDEHVHIAHMNPPDLTNRRWHAVNVSGEPTSFVYGASLTAIDERRAVRFGGFQGGGYSNETNEISLLTMEEQGNDVTATWETIRTCGIQPSARAYHSATLINNRFMVVIGGMGDHGSMLREAILDCHTWTWLDATTIVSRVGPEPSGRHGHSVVLDPARNRLLLFGGGSGTDLLRSGFDNTEVWELKMGDCWISDLKNSLPWSWRLIHNDHNVEDETDEISLTSHITPTQRLCLGRCHVGVRLAKDMALLAFGSGHPTTNGLLAYNLQLDAFVSPQVLGPLPVPRFTAAAAVADHDGWLVFHGGYSVQRGESIGDTVILDLAPAMKRSFPALHMAEVGDYGIVSQPAVQSDGPRWRQNERNIGEVVNQIFTAPRDERRALAGALLSHLLNRGDQIGSRAAMILTMVANGTAAFGDEEDSDDLDDSDDYSENEDAMSVNL